MSEKEQMALQLFFDGIQAHIKEFKLYMKNEIKEEKKEKSHVDRFLNDVMLEVTETINEVEILKDRKEAE